MSNEEINDQNKNKDLIEYMKYIFWNQKRCNSTSQEKERIIRYPVKINFSLVNQ